MSLVKIEMNISTNEIVKMGINFQNIMFTKIILDREISLVLFTNVWKEKQIWIDFRA